MITEAQPRLPRLRPHNIDTLAAIAGFSTAPLSIALSETFLTIALLARLAKIVGGERIETPRIFHLWLLWAALEILSWLRSPQLPPGLGEMRHLLLILALFVTLPSITAHKFIVWRGLFITSTIGAATLLINTAIRTVKFAHEISVGGDPAFLLRNGGFLHHWMIYATVEILVFGALLEFSSLYPEYRKWTLPALAIHCLAILFSLTRILWLAALLVAAVHLWWRRSKWILILPALPIAAFLAAPQFVQSRVIDSSRLDYYSNDERLQMWRVGWKMIRDHRWFGVGPGRVEALYSSYLSKSETLPAYHGHLHDNALQIAAQFGIPVLTAAVLWLAILLIDLHRANRATADRDARFLCRAAILGVFGFLIVGLTDYDYGHALGLILFSFVALSPLLIADPASHLGGAANEAEI